jgi:integrase
MATIEKRKQTDHRKDGKPGRTTYRVRYRDPSGRSRSRSFTKKSDAEKYKSTVEADLVRGLWHDPSMGRMTFADWVKEYQANTEKRATTAARDSTVLNTHFLPDLGPTPLGAITPHDIQRIVNRMKRKLQPATVRTNYGVLRAVLSAAVQDDKIVRSPCRGVRGVTSPQTTRKVRGGLTAEDITRLVGFMPTEYQPMVLVAGVLGLRWSEVVGLRVGSLHFSNRRLTVSETVAEVEGRLQPADVKTDASRRTFAVPKWLMALLQLHIERNGRTGEEYIFQAPQGGPVRYTNFRQRVWLPAVEAAGYQGVSFHDLRHSSGGLLRQAHAHTQVIQQRLGHKSSRTTTDIYGWVPDETDEEAADALGELFDSRVLFASYNNGDKGSL